MLNIMEQDNKTVSNMSNSELIDVLWQGLNKATLKGTFTINEAYLLKLVHVKLLENVKAEPLPPSTTTESGCQRGTQIVELAKCLVRDRGSPIVMNTATCRCRHVS